MMTLCLLGKSSGGGRSRLQALKPLLPSCLLLLPLVYGLTDKLRNFVLRIFIPQYHFPYVVALSFCQVLVSLLFLNLLHLLGLVPLRRYSRSLGERLLVPSICSSIHAVLSMWTKANGSSSGLVQLTVPLLPLLTVILSFMFKLLTPPSIHISVLITFLAASSFISSASEGISGSQPLDYFYLPLAIVLLSVGLTWLAKVSEAERRSGTPVSAADLYYILQVNQLWLLLLLWMIHPDGPWLVLSQGYWKTLLFHGYLLAILLLGMILNFMVGMSALCVSPLAATLLCSARDLLQPYLRLL